MTPFEKRSRDVAAKFLQTVVVVDDKPYFEAEEIEEVPSGEIVEPGRIGAEREEEQEIVPSIGERQSLPLDAKSLINAFATHGLVCAVVKPENNNKEPLLLQALKALRRADIVVLDWKLYEDNGEKATRIAKQILDGDTGDLPSLRLIAIYTGQGGIPSIINNLKESLFSKRPDKGTICDEGYSVVSGGTRISGFAKEGVVGAREEKIVTTNSLPDVLTAEFAKMTAGLVSNVAIWSLGEIRENTHRMLRKFKPELDPSYITHRILSAPPEDAETHLAPVVLAELQAIIEDGNASSLADADSIREWLEDLGRRGIPLRDRLHSKSVSVAIDAFDALIRNGINDETPTLPVSLRRLLKRLKDEKDKTHKQAISDLTGILSAEQKRAADCDCELSVLMSMRQRYSVPLPVLTQGTIIADGTGKNGRYLICVQPRCDAVRLSNKRAFPFLPMHKPRNGKPFDYVVKDVDTFVKLFITYKPHLLKMIEFAPIGRQKQITAIREDDGYVFTSTKQMVPVQADGTWATEERQTKYRWIAELKPEYAQRVANVFADELSRVGLTESEWLRRHAKKSRPL